MFDAEMEFFGQSNIRQRSVIRQGPKALTNPTIQTYLSIYIYRMAFSRDAV